MTRLTMGVIARLALPLAALALPAAAQETRELTDGLGRSVEIPAEPRRIVSLHDQSVTLSLVELGAPVVGSHGRVRGDGSTYLRAVDTLFDTDFGNSDIAYVGTWQAMDFEAIAALKPDLVIGRAPWDEEMLPKLDRIAPTVMVGGHGEGLDFIRNVADASGTLTEYEEQLADHRALVEDARGWIGDPSALTYSKIQGHDGALEAYATYGALTMALDDLGLQPTETARAMRDRGVTWGEEVSAELLPELDADFVFDTYRIDQGQGDGPQAAYDRLSDVLPGWCDLLSGCAEGRYVLVPREHAAPIAFRTLELNVHVVVSHVGSRLAGTE